ncbi:MAG: hypothetical protein SOV74_07640 [Coriobacteriales bacterium]|nr:hypothetical protein [Coriobacteriales bacterium]
MARYELLVSTPQSTCGGKSPRDVKVQVVETDDPKAYVAAIVPDCELEVEQDTPDHLTVSYMGEDGTVVYDFTLDD